MSTVPRASRPLPTASSLFNRPGSQFDAGINTSTAWTEHLERGSLSDEDPDDQDDEQQQTRPARALYNFEGKPEFRELTVVAGDAIDVIKEELADGWSLVKNVLGEIGLLPRSYYTFTSHLSPAPDLELASAGVQSSASPSRDGSITPSRSPSHIPAPIIPQDTGEWLAFPSFRQSLLGGKTLNRFSNFVTSGAEEWVLKGTAADVVITSQPHHEKEESGSHGGDDVNKSGTGEADRHFVDVGPSWKSKLPSFSVLVHSPSKVSTLSGAYTVYKVTSSFHLPSLSETRDTMPASENGAETSITVQRRFSHFVILHTALTRRLPGIALPPLPEKQYAGRFNDEFIEARRGDLERYINRVVRHPIARYAEVLTFFLGCDNDMEWKKLMPTHLSLPPAGPSFYARVFHPAFNLDFDEAAESADRFQSHIGAVGRGVQALRNIFGHMRTDGLFEEEMSKAERLLSYSLLSMITGKMLASASMTGVREEDESTGTVGKGKGILNSEGAWCWREGCSDCLSLSKAIQKTAETLQNTAALYDDHARRTELSTHEALKAVAHPSSLYDPIIDTHRSSLSKYYEATRLGKADEEMAARCETVLNTTMAEMETYHAQKLEDFRSLMTEHLDSEIVFYEQILHRLRSARRTYDEPQFTRLASSPRAPSMYERDLENAAGPRIVGRPLPQPCPHVFDSAPMRPVSVAIQEGVGMLFGSGPGRRGSTFKFW